MTAAALLHLPGLRIVVSGLVGVPDRCHRAPPSEAQSIDRARRKDDVRRGAMPVGISAPSVEAVLDDISRLPKEGHDA